MDLSKIIEPIKTLFSGDRKVKLIMAIGLAGMVLILIAQLSDTGSGRNTKDTAPADTQGTEYLNEAYAQQLEDKLQNLISSVDGVGRTRVMVTLEHGAEYIYAQEEKSSVDKTTQESGQESYKQDTQNSYVFVDAGYGEKQALIRTQVPPKVQGVVIVCEGADNILIQSQVINVVTTALHIPTTRVCVVKINAE